MDAYDVDTNVITAKMTSAMMMFAVMPIADDSKKLFGIKSSESKCIMRDANLSVHVNRFAKDRPQASPLIHPDIFVQGMVEYRGFSIDILEMVYGPARGFKGFYWKDGNKIERSLVTGTGEYVSPQQQLLFMQDVSKVIRAEMGKIDDYLKRQSH